MYYVYILASKYNGTLYIGVTNNLLRRVYEHKNKIADSFTAKHTVCNLVYFESTPDVYSALQREKQLKKWNRQWKINLIADIMIFGGEKYTEPIANHGPFVMNYEHELPVAYSDFKSGKYGKIEYEKV